MWIRMLCLAIIIAFTFMLTCCWDRDIDSMQEFNQAQAASIVRQWYEPKATEQSVVMSLPQSLGWHRMRLKEPKQGSPYVLLPRGQTETDWQQIIRTDIRSYRFDPELTVRRYGDDLINEVSMQCHNVKVYFFNETQDGSLFSIRMKNCMHGPDQIKVVTLMNGVDAIYEVDYVALLDKVSEKQIQQMIQVLKSAKLYRRI